MIKLLRCPKDRLDFRCCLSPVSAGGGARLNSRTKVKFSLFPIVETVNSENNEIIPC